LTLLNIWKRSARATRARQPQRAQAVLREHFFYRRMREWEDIHQQIGTS